MFNYRSKFILFPLIAFSCIPTFYFINQLVFSNPSSGDWYLAFQLIEIAKARSQSLQLFPYIQFVDQQGLPLFGNFAYSNGMQILTPDILLFRFFTIQNCIILHLLFVYSLGIIFAIKLGYFFKLNKVQILIFASVWLNASPISARLSEGHVQLIGYILIPGFFYFLFKLIEVPCSQNAIQLAIFLSFNALLGGSHIYFQMMLILFIYLLFRKLYLLNFIQIFIYSLFSASIQILPPIFFPFFIAGNRSVYEGYGYHFIEKFFSMDRLSNNFEIVRELISVPFHIFVALFFNTKTAEMGGWEWTLYFGVLPSTMIILYFWKIRNALLVKFQSHLPLISVGILALSIVYRAIFLLISYFIPVTAVDRIPYRMIIYPLCFIWLKTVKNTKFFNYFTKSYKNYYTLSAILFLVLITDLAYSNYVWFTRHIGVSEIIKTFNLVTLNNYNYKNFLIFFLLLTLSCWVINLFYIFKKIQL